MSPAAPPERRASALVQARRIFCQVKNKFLRPKVLTNIAKILTSLTGGSGQARGRSARMSRK